MSVVRESRLQERLRSMNAATLPVKTSCFEYLSKFVRQKSAIVLEPSKSYLMESRLGPIARENDLDSLEELVELLQRPDRPDIAQRVIDAMTTNESSFFRDIHPFEALRKDVIPSLIEKRSRERTLNIGPTPVRVARKSTASRSC
jgi:chemotaxis protein methyltransferase CheR